MATRRSRATDVLKDMIGRSRAPTLEDEQENSPSVEKDLPSTVQTGTGPMELASSKNANPVKSTSAQARTPVGSLLEMPKIDDLHAHINRLKTHLKGQLDTGQIEESDFEESLVILDRALDQKNSDISLYDCPGALFIDSLDISTISPMEFEFEGRSLPFKRVKSNSDNKMLNDNLSNEQNRMVELPRVVYFLKTRAFGLVAGSHRISNRQKAGRNKVSAIVEVVKDDQSGLDERLLRDSMNSNLVVPMADVEKFIKIQALAKKSNAKFVPTAKSFGLEEHLAYRIQKFDQLKTETLIRIQELEPYLGGYVLQAGLRFLKKMEINTDKAAEILDTAINNLLNKRESADLEEPISEGALTKELSEIAGLTKKTRVTKRVLRETKITDPDGNTLGVSKITTFGAELRTDNPEMLDLFEKFVEELSQRAANSKGQ